MPNTDTLSAVVKVRLTEATKHELDGAARHDRRSASEFARLLIEAGLREYRAHHGIISYGR